MAKKKSRSKKAPKNGPKGATQMVALTRRVSIIESALRRPPDLSHPGKRAAPPPAARALEFSLATGSAANVRVTLDHSEVVLFAGWSTPSKPRAKGDWVSVLIEVLGNPGEKAIVDITNSKPAQLTSPPIASGTTHIADPRLIEASWT